MFFRCLAFHTFPNRLLVQLVVISFFLFQAINCESKTYFPEFNSISSNVRFWERVYGEFSTNTAVLHDRNDLSIIYEAAPILDKSLPGATRINRTYLRALRKKYATVLSELGRGKTAATVFEKRVYSLFSPPGIRTKMLQASDNIRMQSGLKERFIEGVIRSGAYIDEMKRIFSSYGLPEDLAYLPHVESSFNIKAFSKRGAAGVWQFTRATGKNFMMVDSIVDERRDPLTATHAAARYLKSNFDRLGTWPLAITAYNYGHAGMMRALKQEGNYVRIFKNYRTGHFKFASRNFYAEFLAARTVAKKLETSPLIRKDRPSASFSFTLPAYAQANALAAHFGLSSDRLQQLNPALRPPIWRGEKYIPKGYVLRLPHTASIVRLAKIVPANIYSQTQKRAIFYTVRSSDTAGKIARRFGVSLKELSRANNLDDKAVVYIGQTLRIPSSHHAKSTAATASSTSPDYAVILRSESKSKPSGVSVLSQPLTANAELRITSSGYAKDTHYGELIVQPEESLGLLSEWLSIDQKSLSAFNALSPDSSIHPGQQLKVPFTAVSRQQFEERRLAFHSETEKDFFSSYKITGFQKYKVALGDTLWDICQNKFDLPLWLLKKYNRDLQFNSLASDQHLHIPVIEAL